MADGTEDWTERGPTQARVEELQRRVADLEAVRDGETAERLRKLEEQVATLVEEQGALLEIVGGLVAVLEGSPEGMQEARDRVAGVLQELRGDRRVATELERRPGRRP